MRRNDPENTSRSYFRTQDRVFAQNGQWFFASREGEVGPFATRETAMKEVSRYVQERRDLERFQKAREIQHLHRNEVSLAIMPKDEAMELSLEDLILENQS